MRKYKVNVISQERETKFMELDLKSPAPTQVLVKVKNCAICTLEQRIYSGVMKRYPFAGGHEVSGIVEEIGEAVSGISLGNKVAIRLLTSCGICYYCRSGHENQCIVSFKAAIHNNISGPGGMAEYMLVDAKDVFVLSENVDLTHAALTEPLACCVHSIENADIRLAEDVVVIGVGIMGALHIQLAKLRGARVIACEMDCARLEMAKKMGADIVINSREGNVVEKVKALTGNRGADVVFCTAAIPQVAQDSVEMLGKLGRVVFYSSFHPDDPISLNANLVHSNEVRITGAVNPNIRDFHTAARLLSEGLVDVSLCISDVVPLSEIDQAYQRALDPSSFRVVVNCGTGSI